MRWLRPRRRRTSPSGWEGTRSGRRILVEHGDEEVRDLLRRQLVEHGYRVATCAGPVDLGDHVECPVLSDQRCPAVDDADAIISGMDLTLAANRQLVAALAADEPHRPVIVDPRLRVADDPEAVRGDHHLYRTVVAPLVRRLHDVLWDSSTDARTPSS